MNETAVHRDAGHGLVTCRAEVLPRMSAALSGACLLLHIVLVFVAGPGALSMSLPMLALAALCASCAVSAWRRRCSDRELWLMALIAAAMVFSHLILKSDTPGLAICSSAINGLATRNLAGLSGMNDAGTSADGISAVAEFILPVSVACAGVTALIAIGVLAQRRLAQRKNGP